MTERSRVACVLLAMMSLACTSSPPETPDGNARPGRLVIVGGALQASNAAVYGAVLESRSGGGPICVIPTASADPEESMAGAVERLNEHGGVDSAKGVLISTQDPSRARDASVAAELEACGGFFFTGGSQSRILDVFLPGADTTVAYRAVWQRWRDGAVVAGTSAGAAMMSRVMISGGGSDEAVAHGVAGGPEEDGVQIRSGMGFFEPMLDQHFLARGRIGRLLVSVAHEDLPDIGLGIDENTALVVDGDSAVVVGASGVIVVDGRTAQRPGPNRVSGLIVTLAGAGDVLDLGDYTVHRASGKALLSDTTASIDPPEDPFERWAFLHLITALSSSSAVEQTFTLSFATLRVAKAPDFSASVAGTGEGVEGTPSGLSAGPFLVDLLSPGS